MKKITCIIILLASLGFHSQTKAQVVGTLGKYSGYSEPYSIGVVAGKDIIVPGIQHSFNFLAKNSVSLVQVSDKGDKAQYKGTSTTTLKKDGSKMIVCKMLEVTTSAYPSKPEYHILFSVNGSIKCQENPGSKVKTSPFELKKD